MPEEKKVASEAEVEEATKEIPAEEKEEVPA